MIFLVVISEAFVRPHLLLHIENKTHISFDTLLVLANIRQAMIVGAP